MVHSRDQRWEEQYARLEAFLTEHKRLPRFFCEDKEEESIGSWIRGQRRSAALGRLTVGRINRLRNLPVPGVLDKVEAPDKLEELAAFQRTHGRLPKTTAENGSDEYRIAHYMVNNLRPKIKSGTAPAGYASRAARIPGVVLFSYVPDQDEKLEALRAFIETNGHLPRYRGNAAREESRLGQWVNNILYAADDMRQDGDRARRLAEIRKLVAETPTYRQHRAAEILAILEAYVAKHGHLPRTTAPDQAAQQAYLWLARRRDKEDADELGPDLAPRVKELLKEDRPLDAKWEARLDELVTYVKDHGKLPTGFHDGPVYNWLRGQRAAYRQGKMSEYREHVLRAINGVLPPPAKKSKLRRKRVDLVLKREPTPDNIEPTIRI